jgi:DNA mismatch repair protein MutH
MNPCGLPPETEHHFFEQIQNGLQGNTLRNLSCHPNRSGIVIPIEAKRSEGICGFIADQITDPAHAPW